MKMNKQTRRDFLVHSAAAGLAAAGTGDLLAQGAAPAEMAIARWTGPPQPTAAELPQIAIKLTERAIAAIGGLKRFIRQGDKVWVKPNIAWDRAPELGANTNPDVVATIVRLCWEAGAKTVTVGDNTCNVATATYKSSGIADAARKAGAQVVFLDPTRFREMAIRGERLKTLPVCPEIVESDLVINVPIAKHHRLADVTLCMKNYMGVIDKRNTLHQAIAECLADLTRFMRPRLCILDAVRVLPRNGPRGGDPKDVVLKLAVGAGTDIVALDAWGAEQLGRKPGDVPTLVEGQKAGLGKLDYRSLAPKEIAVS